jgi:hypothetical protein
MTTQSLRKCALSTPHAIPELKLPTQTKRRKTSSSFNQNASVVIIRWISVIFCLGFWYGVYKLVGHLFLTG